MPSGVHTPEQRERKRLAALARWSNPEYRTLQRLAHTKHKPTCKLCKVRRANPLHGGFCSERHREEHRAQEYKEREIGRYAVDVREIEELVSEQMDAHIEEDDVCFVY